MIESGHGTEVLLREVLSMGGGDQTVGVGWVSDDEGSYVTIGVIVKGPSLRNEYLGILL
jgi:hypothetical protein